MQDGNDIPQGNESANMASKVPNISSAGSMSSGHLAIDPAGFEEVDQSWKETFAQLCELDARLREAREGHQRAYANGYVDGLNALVDGKRAHAFTVTADEEVIDKFRWLCACGWVTFQEPAGTEQTPIQTRLTAHIAEATAVDLRTARALAVDGCSCPPEVGDHWHKLYVRRLASTGKLTSIVVEARWYDQTGSARMEVLCWPLTKNGVADAVSWVREHAAKWDDGTPVTAEELARRAAGWLR